MRLGGFALSFLVLAVVQLPWVECIGHALHLASELETTSHTSRVASATNAHKDCQHSRSHRRGHSHRAAQHTAGETQDDHEHVALSWEFPAPRSTMVFGAPAINGRHIDTPLAHAARDESVSDATWDKPVPTVPRTVVLRL